MKTPGGVSGYGVDVMEWSIQRTDCRSYGGL